MTKRLSTYEDWKTCITVDCGIPLTRPYCLERIAELRRGDEWPTNRFIETWGDAHRLRVIAWFERAARELEGAVAVDPPNPR